MAETVIGNAPYLTQYIPNLTGNYYHSTWETPEAFRQHIAAMDPKQAWDNSAWEKGMKDFTGTESMDEALRLADCGWKEGVDKVVRLRDTIIAANPTIIQPVKYGIAGSVPNVPRAIAGNPLNMKAND